MYLVTLANAIVHLNNSGLNPTAEENNYISSLIDVAFYSIKNYCKNTTWVDSSGFTSGTTEFSDYTISGTTIPLPIRHAILLLVGNFYANREPVAFSSPVVIPYTLEYLLAPYINYEVDYPTYDYNTLYPGIPYYPPFTL